jgi:hypothetical protein
MIFTRISWPVTRVAESEAGERQSPDKKAGQHHRRKGEAEDPDRALAAKPRLELRRTEQRDPERREDDRKSTASRRASKAQASVVTGSE